MGFDLGLGNMLGSIGGGLLGGIGGAISTAIQNRQNMKLAKYQYEKNLEMWNRENEYNTPSAQRGRMEDAGFNPNLVYGHGSVANTAASAPQYQAPHIQAYTDFGDFGIGQGINSYVSAKLAEANIDKTKQETENLTQYNKIQQQEEILKSLDVVNKRIQNSRDQTELDYLVPYKDLLIDQLGVEVKQAESNLANSQLDYEMKEFGFNLDKLWSGLERWQSYLNQTQDYKIKQVQYKEVESRIKEIFSRIGLNNIQSNKLAAEIPGVVAESDSKVAVKEIQKRAARMGLNLNAEWIPALLGMAMYWGPEAAEFVPDNIPGSKGLKEFMRKVKK